jgi:aspartate aminotransferase-like enzyme
MAKQVEHHRTPEARQNLAEALSGLKQVFRTAGDVILLSCSGTGAMEAAVVNAVPRGGKVIVLEAGRFAQRWGEVSSAFGIEVVRHMVTWGEAIDPADVAKLLDEHPDAVAVFATLQETSTGVAHDIEAIGRVVAPHKALFVVDAISGAGVQECHVDAWGIDMLVVGSQKALMLPPGLAFVTVSEAAWKQIATVQPQAFYFNLSAYKKKLNDPDTPFTPAHTLVAALNQCLKIILAEGMDTVWARARQLSRATRAGVEAMGLEVFAQRPADGVTSVKFPEGINGSAMLKRIEKRYGVKLAGGQSHLQGKIFRIAHLGVVDELDVIGALYAIEMTLNEMGHHVELGSAVRAAGGVFREDEVPAVAGA